MIKKIIEKGNFSGEKAEIKIFKNKVSLYGVCGQEKWEDFNINIQRSKCFISFSVTHKNWDYLLITGYLDKDNIWYAQNNNCIQRQSECLHTAIARVLYNIL